MRQSRTMSMLEAATNVVVGYVLAIATQIVVFPWFGIETTVLDLTRYGIVLRKSAVLSPNRQAEILAIVAAIADDLGFANPGSGEDPGFPSPGSAFAIHPALADLDASITEDMQADPPGEPGDGFDVWP